MKASESHPQFASKVREYTNFAVRGITKVCKEIGPRPCGGEAERKAQEYMLSEFKTCADEAHIEDFETHPGAFMGWFKIDAVLMLISIILFVCGLPQFALIPAVISLIILLGEFLFYRQLTDVFYPKKKSCNTIAVRKAAASPGRQSNPAVYNRFYKQLAEPDFKENSLAQALEKGELNGSDYLLLMKERAGLLAGEDARGRNLLYSAAQRLCRKEGLNAEEAEDFKYAVFSLPGDYFSKLAALKNLRDVYFL